MTMAYLAYQLGSLLIQMCHNVQVILCALQQIRQNAYGNRKLHHVP